MNKKFKYTSLVAAGAVTLGLVGGTLAWFTSQDLVVNPFATGTTDNPNDPNSGIDINENFNPDDADNVVPGDDVTKEVQVTNKASYDQFVRAHIVVKVTESVSDENQNEPDAVEEGSNEGNQSVPSTPITPNHSSIHRVIKKGDKYVVEGYEDIELHFKPFGALNITTSTDEDDKVVKTVDDEGKWYTDLDANSKLVDYFYYLGKVKADDTSKDSGLGQDLNYTNSLLESVELLNTAGNQYKNIKFDVIVGVDSIQAQNDAYLSWCDDESLQAVYDVLQDGETTPPTDGYAE